MKKIGLILLSLILLSKPIMADEPIGLSIGLLNTPSLEKLKEIKKSGINHIEVTMNYFWRNAPENEYYTRAFRVKNMVDSADLKVWSCHLPFSKTLDISVLDKDKREANIALMEKMIRLAGIFKPTRLVLHPSSEPISDEEREIRLQNSADAIGRLSLVAKEIGAILCIENLPRTCLGKNSDEIMRLIANYPEVMVCFDSNHLLSEEHASFFERVGNRIGTVHLSDYDRVDERHWLPGKGVIDWADFYIRLKKSGYKGVMMHEVRSGEATYEDIIKAYQQVILGKKK